MRERKRVAKNQTFHIRIGPNADKLNIKDPQFRKILEQQYATKYLESLGVQSSLKNINKILKENPLDNCEIIESRLHGGLHTDTITIVTKSVNEQAVKKIENQPISNEMLEVLNLKPMKLKKDQTKVTDLRAKPETIGEKDKEEKGLSLEILSFEITDIKERYIFPFNENFKRKNHYRMKDANNVMEVDREESKIIYQARIFNFPFTQVKLPISTLKELQSPITAQMTDIIAFLERFYQQFPTHIFPVEQLKLSTKNQGFSSLFDKKQKNESEKGGIKKKNKSHLFQQKQIDCIFDLIKSEQNAKLIGVFLHLAYWCTFGGVNPIQIDKTMKRKMYTMMYETLEYFEIKTDNGRLWKRLGYPMLLLTLKMAARYFFNIHYPKLFWSQESRKIDAHEIAFDKILFLIEKLFDQGNVKGRFVFLESDIDGQKGNFIKDKKFIRKRIFGTSPALNLCLTNPKDGKARSIMAKNMQIDQQQGTLNDHQYLRDEVVDKESQAKLLNLALHKIKVRVQGSKANNPIINIGQQ